MFIETKRRKKEISKRNSNLLKKKTYKNTKDKEKKERKKRLTEGHT